MHPCDFLQYDNRTRFTPRLTKFQLVQKVTSCTYNAIYYLECITLCYLYCILTVFYWTIRLTSLVHDDFPELMTFHWCKYTSPPNMWGTICCVLTGAASICNTASSLSQGALRLLLSTVEVTATSLSLDLKNNVNFLSFDFFDLSNFSSLCSSLLSSFSDFMKSLVDLKGEIKMWMTQQSCTFAKIF